MRRLVVLAAVTAAAFPASAGAMSQNNALWNTYTYGQHHCVRPGTPGGYCRNVYPSSCRYLWMNQAYRPQWACSVRVQFGTVYQISARQTDQIAINWDPYGRVLATSRTKICLC